MSEQNTQNIRINVFVSARAAAMLDEMGRELYPAQKRTGGAVVDAAIREKYERYKQDRKRSQS